MTWVLGILSAIETLALIVLGLRHIGLQRQHADKRVLLQDLQEKLDDALNKLQDTKSKLAHEREASTKLAGARKRDLQELREAAVQCGPGTELIVADIEAKLRGDK